MRPGDILATYILAPNVLVPRQMGKMIIHYVAHGDHYGQSCKAFYDRNLRL